MLPLFSVAVLGACEGPPDDPYYQPSSLTPFDFAASDDFAAYTRHMRNELGRHRVFFDPVVRKAELDRVAPYEMPPAEGCSPGPVHGVLLVHGLLDTAFALRDIATRLSDACMLVRGVLLPGHGTRPADLIDATREEWIEVVDFGIRSLAEDADHVHLVGYSLGGALAMNAALDDPRVESLVLLAPALQVSVPWLAWNASWYRYVNDWVDIDPHSIPVRYQSMPTHAIAETYALAGDVRAKLLSDLDIPVMMILSAQDLAIDNETALLLYDEHMQSAGNRAILYGADTELRPSSGIEVIDVFDAEEMVLNYSHVALPFSPNNPVFGRDGSHKECGLNIGLVPKEQAEACIARAENWKGEIGSSNDEAYWPLQRLTYHPRFAEMADAIVEFLLTTHSSDDTT